MVDQNKEVREQWDNSIDISKEQWMMLLEEQDIIKEQDVRLLQLLYSKSECKATAGQLAEILHMPHHAPLNTQVGRLGKRIVNYLNIHAIRQRYGDGYNWWEVPFIGYSSREGFYWQLRPELQEAMRELSVMGEISLMVKGCFPFFVYT